MSSHCTATMQVTMCMEVLLATICLWVAIFGIFDAVVERFDKKWQQVSVYLVVAGAVCVFLMTHKNVSVCSLM